MADSDESEMFDADGYPMCPYCKSIDSCVHLLLIVDVTFRDTQGGALSDAFSDKWWSLSQDEQDNHNFSERESFNTLLQEVEDLCDYDLIWEGFDNMPGMSSSYQIYWCKDEASIKDALDHFSKIEPDVG